MKVSLIMTVLAVFFFLGGLNAQEYSSVSESRKESIRSILNYRYKGGFYTFEKHFNTTVTYPESAKLNCRIGICVVSLKIDCDGEIVEVTLKNPLKLGIDEEITNFINSTTGNWNTCTDDKYTKFDVPIQFRLRGVETNSTDAVLIVEDEPILGQTCFGDEYYIEKVEKLMEKKKGKKVLQYLHHLIRRNPYNTDYYEMQKEALSYQKN